MANYVHVSVNVTVVFDADTGRKAEVFVDPDGVPPDPCVVWNEVDDTWENDYGDFIPTAEEFVSGLIAHAVGDAGIEAIP